MLEYLSAVQIKIVKDYFCYELLNFKILFENINKSISIYIHLILSRVLSFFSFLLIFDK